MSKKRKSPIPARPYKKTRANGLSTKRKMEITNRINKKIGVTLFTVRPSEALYKGKEPLYEYSIR